MLFAALLFSRNLAPTTIKTYLAALRFQQISLGLDDPMIAKMLQLEYVMRGIKRHATPGNCRCLPITPRILLLMKQFWAADPGNVDWKMLWAALCLCFFGFLRSGEVVAPSKSQFDPETNLCFEDIRIDSRSHPTYMQVILKALKTDPFRQGTSLCIGTTNSQLCPVATVLSFMVAKERAAGPLFSWQNGRYLTRDKFVAEIREVLAAVGLKPEESQVTDSGSVQRPQLHRWAYRIL